MAYSSSSLSSTGPRTSARIHRIEDCDSSSGTDSRFTIRNVPNSRSRTPFPPPSPSPVFLGPPSGASGRSSRSSTPLSTPQPSRPVSPLPQFFSSASGPSSSCTSETESEIDSPLLGGRAYRNPLLRETRRSWWGMGSSASLKKKRKREGGIMKNLKRFIRLIIRHPLFPKQPITIIFTLVLFTVFAGFLTLLLMNILNPDKEPLPWRAYCSMPSPRSGTFGASPSSSYAIMSDSASDYSVAEPFPPDDLDSYPPAGVFVGVFSTDSAFERRMLVRNTWAGHPRSRNGAAHGDGGIGTSRTVVRFILGQPRKSWERRIKLEMETFKDIVLLPTYENMNSGKTHRYFSWAAEEAWVPPILFNTSKPAPNFTYSNVTSPASLHTSLAGHDPFSAWENKNLSDSVPWTRPDFVIKADDDSFLMLAELEARLRVELHAKSQNPHPPTMPAFLPIDVHSNTSFSSSPLTSSATHEPTSDSPDTHHSLAHDPMVYWGYLVKNRFMGGELYGLSWNLVDWVSKDQMVKGMTKGAEDKQTAKWMRAHPRHGEVRWVSESCWIYDHPRAGTVYTHGFLFPSEVSRVRRSIVSYSHKTPQDVLGNPSGSQVVVNISPTPSAWAYSSVATFGVRYTPPVPDLTIDQSVEALVEGSDMSIIREGSTMTPEYAWLHREGRTKRYEGKRVGGTVVVHFIKKNMWFLETALALLEGEERSEHEEQMDHHDREPKHTPAKEKDQVSMPVTSWVDSSTSVSSSSVGSTRLKRQRAPSS